MYGDFVVETFDQKPSASYARPTGSSPFPKDDDVITGEKVAKLLLKVRGVYAESALSQYNVLHLLQGPYVYELFSIMVHSGSATGGHYYAYIKYIYNSIYIYHQ